MISNKETYYVCGRTLLSHRNKYMINSYKNEVEPQNDYTNCEATDIKYFDSTQLNPCKSKTIITADQWLPRAMNKEKD